jgi:hypothetical protein
VKASAFYRAGGRRGCRRLQWPAMKASVTCSEEGGGVYVRVKAHDRVKEGARSLRSLHGVGEGRRGAHGAVAREEAAALPARCGRKEMGGKYWAGGRARPASPLGAKRPGGLAGH